jgi:4-aminobutyrate aminotransferase / (S)-3-amino-2-methylpropionate transaminase / 5-aminovalerate transaminase
MTGAGTSTRRVIDLIARLGGGGVRRIARSADIVVNRGSGSYLYGEGVRYLDLVSGYGVASLGHCHPQWVDAVVAQANQLTVTPLHTAELARYLDALARVLPPRLGRTALFSGGAEAVEAAIRLVQTATDRRAVLTFRDSFHGKTSGVRYSADPGAAEAQSLGPGWLRSERFPACDSHGPTTYAQCEEPPGDITAFLSEAAHSEPLAAVLVEPVLGTAGNIPPKRPFLAALRQACDELGALLVFDESITGFGRTGELFAFEYFGVEPDVLILGKGLGGGFPLSAVCAASAVWDGSALSVPSACSSSYGGNPLACAAGLATLEIVTSGEFLGQVRTVGALAAARLEQLAAASPYVARPRGVGLMLGFDLMDPTTGELAPEGFCDEVFRDCRDRGLLLAVDVPRVRLSPPLTLTSAEAGELFDVLFEVLA